MATTIRLGVLGAGIMGRRVAAAAVGTGRFEVVAVADADRVRAESLAGEYGASAHGGVADLCAVPDLDAVYVGLPHALHLEACAAAAAAGVHVLVDKPLCTTAAEADRIGALAAASDRVWMVGFSYRYRAEWQRAQQIIAGGELGLPYFVLDTAIEAYVSTPGWYWDAAAGGGTIQLQSHHSFDRIAWLIDSDATGVSCRIVRPPGSAEVSAQISATYRSGLVAGISLSFGRTYDAVPRTLFVLQAERGMLEIDEDRTLRVTTADGVLTESHADDDWLGHELGAFAGAVDGDGFPFPGIAAGRAALQCALAAERAATSDSWMVPDA
ncbi:gfo/Idh/MocA family oxidoreductase [Nocardioides marmoriginsengisoli]|uniref:Gfo/Idh/MocA family oxidoreductase n=1 Tax=Nocardioides marmoriginsengisoli TaxID=661483 RepID=A0A3N0CHU3_9ACTN|nr:Gfo/Idh/MocA family oxidoreductase [Nocardioides marmoriginsengisoli]RNL62533.1 gfo/Idh/MocA family oxidoreductase [Nocardioides marmoriginsengisoli]